jgi:hypothetical protein
VSFANVTLKWHDTTQGGLVIELNFPPGTFGSELANLSFREQRDILEPALKTIGHGFRRVREQRRGPSTDVR